MPLSAPAAPAAPRSSNWPATSQGGIVEADFGITLRELVEGYGGGTRSGRPLKAVQVGGPLGAYVAGRPTRPADGLRGDRRGRRDARPRRHRRLRRHRRRGRMARFAMEFCAKESCGKCTPCRIGSVRGVEVIDRIRSAPDADSRHQAFVLLEDLCTTMEKGSLCAMGGLTPMPVRSALRHFPADFAKNPPVDSDEPTRRSALFVG
jgi:NADH:ubiquinone oxidoreductase subunit F (NADH-binding)